MFHTKFGTSHVTEVRIPDVAHHAESIRGGYFHRNKGRKWWNYSLITGFSMIHLEYRNSSLLDRNR